MYKNNLEYRQSNEVLVRKRYSRFLAREKVKQSEGVTSLSDLLDPLGLRRQELAAKGTNKHLSFRPCLQETRNYLGFSP